MKSERVKPDLRQSSEVRRHVKYTRIVLLFHSIVGGVLGAIWLSRVIDFAFGMPKIADISKPQWDLPISHAGNIPRVTIVVPAKNEEECIERCLTSLLALEYSNLEIIAVDDRSTDCTGAIMDRLAGVSSGESKLKVIHVKELPIGWLGKTHAMWKAAGEGTGEWILFTDGDIIFRPDCLRRAVAYLNESQADHLVLCPTIIMHSIGERMMMSFLQVLFAFIRPWKVADPKSRISMGAGAFNLIRRSAYEKLGTYQELRLAVIDDLQLGAAVKQNGFSQRIVFGRGLISVRWAKSAFGVVQNLTKNVFALMRFRWDLAVAAALAMAIVNVGPFVGILVAPGWSKLGYAMALVSIAMLYWGMSGLSKVSPLYFLAHPFSSTLFAFTILRSAWLTLGQGGVIWRGTKYSLDELRQSVK